MKRPEAPDKVNLWVDDNRRLHLPPWPYKEGGFIPDWDRINTYISKNKVTDYLSQRLKALWNASSAQDDHDAYYKDPVVQEIKKFVNFINEFEEY